MIWKLRMWDLETEDIYALTVTGLPGIETQEVVQCVSYNSSKGTLDSDYRGSYIFSIYRDPRCWNEYGSRRHVAAQGTVVRERKDGRRGLQLGSVGSESSGRLRASNQSTFL